MRRSASTRTHLSPDRLRIIFGSLGAAFVGLAGGCSNKGDPTGPDIPLTIELRSPSEGAEVAGSISLIAASSDAARVVFAVDGTEIGADTEGPIFHVTWSSTSAGNGSHRVKATAFSASNSVIDDANVLVNNPGGGVGVGIFPGAVSLERNQTHQFTATVVGTVNPAVNWSIDEGSTHGTITTNGLYTAPATLPASTMVTVRATSQAEWTKSGTVNVTLTGGPGGQVSVSPAAAIVAVGQAQQFSSTVTGDDTNVTWSVDEGTTHGSISSAGLFSAPTTLPFPAATTIRATSVADPTKSSTAVVTLIDGGVGFLQPDEVPLLSATYFAGFRTLQTIDDANKLAARAFFEASCLNGNQPTTIGTLTQVTRDSEFSYAASPQDRLRVVLFGGVTFEIVYFAVEGNLGELRCDDQDAFLVAHTDFRYQISAPGSSIEISSAFIPLDELQSQFTQSLAGVVTVANFVWTVSASLQGTHQVTHDEQGSSRLGQSVVNGVFTSGDLRIEVAQQHSFYQHYNGHTGETFTRSTDIVQNQGTRGATALLLQFQDVVSEVDSRIETTFELEGAVLRNGRTIGGLVTDSRTGAVGVELNLGPIVPL